MLVDFPGGDAGWQVHAQLAAPQAPVEDIFRILLRLHDGIEQVLALVQMFPDPPFLHAEDPDDGLGDACLLDFGHIDGAPSGAGGAARERSHHPAHVHVFNVPEFAEEVEDEPPRLFVAQGLQLGGIRGAVEFVEN